METRGQAGQVDTDTTIRLAAPFTDAWNRHDVKTLMAMFHPQGMLSTPALAHPLSGAALQGYLEAQLCAFSDIQAEAVGDRLVGGNTVSGRYRISGTWIKPMSAGPLTPVAPTGKAFLLQSADFPEIKDEKIAVWTQYYDRMSLFSQLGLIAPH